MFLADNTIPEIGYDKLISDRELSMIQDQAGAFFCVLPLLFCTRFGDIIL